MLHPSLCWPFSVREIMQCGQESLLVSGDKNLYPAFPLLIESKLGDICGRPIQSAAAVVQLWSQFLYGVAQTCSVSKKNSHMFSNHTVWSLMLPIWCVESIQRHKQTQQRCSQRRVFVYVQAVCSQTAVCTHNQTIQPHPLINKLIYLH